MGEPVLIWGAGAMGGALGAHLARQGTDVVLVDSHADHVAQIVRNGLKITGPIAAFTVRVPAFTPDSLTGRFRRIVLAVKGHATGEACRMMRPFLADDGYVVSFQNGLNAEAIGDVVGADRVLLSFTNSAADYIAPGEILYGGQGALAVGEPAGGLSARVAETVDLFSAFEAGAIASDNVAGYLWSKQAYGSMLFATAMAHEKVSVSWSILEHRPCYAALAVEVLGVVRALGIHPESFDGFDPEAFRADGAADTITASFEAMAAVHGRWAKVRSGVWRDIAVRKRKTEAEAQLGGVARIGCAQGVALPVFERMIALIGEIEQGRRAQGLENVQALARMACERYPALAALAVPARD